MTEFPFTVARHPKFQAPSSDAMQEFTDAFVQAGLPERQTWRGGQYWGPLLKHLRASRSLWPRRRPGTGVTLAPMMGPRWPFLLPHAWVQDLYIYAYDVWAANETEWEDLVRKVQPVGITANGTSSASFFRRVLPRTPVHVALEAVDGSWTGLQPDLSARRPVDVLQVGRPYRWWHETVMADDRISATKYVYPADGQRLFQTKREYQDALCATKIAICVPRSTSHPQVAAGYPVLTQRYWEAMAAGALILGESVDDLTQLIGYDPVVSIDNGALMDQVIELVGGFTLWIDLRRENLHAAQTYGRLSRLVSELTTQVTETSGGTGK